MFILDGAADTHLSIQMIFNIYIFTFNSSLLFHNSTWLLVQYIDAATLSNVTSEDLNNTLFVCLSVCLPVIRITNQGNAPQPPTCLSIICIFFFFFACNIDIVDEKVHTTTTTIWSLIIRFPFVAAATLTLLAAVLDIFIDSSGTSQPASSGGRYRLL